MQSITNICTSTTMEIRSNKHISVGEVDVCELQGRMGDRKCFFGDIASLSNECMKLRQQYVFVFYENHRRQQTFAPAQNC